MRRAIMILGWTGFVASVAWAQRANAQSTATTESRDITQATISDGDTSAFLMSRWKMLKRGSIKAEEFYDEFAKAADIKPPVEWCYCLALQAALARSPSPRRADKYLKRVDEFKETLSPEGRAIFEEGMGRACTLLDLSEHTHTTSGSRRLARDESGRTLLQIEEKRLALPKNALQEPPSFACCMEVSRLTGRWVVCQFEQLGCEFPIACIDEDTESVLWRNRVNALPVTPGFKSGFFYHDLNIVQTPAHVWIFGRANGRCYAELFNAKNGHQLLRFCPE